MRILLLSLVLFVACGQALAQFGGMRRGGTEGGNRQRPAGDDISGVTRLSTNDQVRLHLTDLRIALKLHTEQNPLFDAYQSRIYALLAEPAHANYESAGAGLQQIDRKIDQARSHVAKLEEASDAAKKLYAALDEEQKKAADRLLPGTLP
jgi:hypothetical protein